MYIWPDMKIFIVPFVFEFLFHFHILYKNLCESNKNSALNLAGHEDHGSADAFVQRVGAFHLVMIHSKVKIVIMIVPLTDNMMKMIQYRELKGDWVHAKAKDTK